ncbi:MAG: hypothetical protein WAM63_05150, partial [Rhodomicrobium sp.]
IFRGNDGNGTRIGSGGRIRQRHRCYSEAQQKHFHASPPLERDLLALSSLIAHQSTMLKGHLGGRPLLETADELCAVARDLNADPGETYLGGRATEREVEHLSDTGQPAQYRRFKDKPKKVKRLPNPHLSLNSKQRHLNRKTICKWLQEKSALAENYHPPLIAL